MLPPRRPRSGGAGGQTPGAGTSAGAESDLAYVKDKGTLIVGMTDFAPVVWIVRARP